MSEKKIKVGITGQSGFIGTHLYNTLELKDNICLIPFEDNFFNENNKLEYFVRECDCIVHLAAMNRHGDSQVIYDTNINLVKELITACETTQSKPHILFSSSSQENLVNLYGKSKKEGRELFIQWALENNSKFTGFIIPNVFGPYGKPFFNSVVATFCHQLTHNEEPKIEIDGLLKLIYVDELVEEFYNAIVDNERTENVFTKNILHSYEAKVTEILRILRYYKETYFNKGTIPKINSEFEYNLFNTLLCFIPFDVYPLKVNSSSFEGWRELLYSGNGGRLEFIDLELREVKEVRFNVKSMNRIILFGNWEVQVWKNGADNRDYYKGENGNIGLIDIPIWKSYLIKNVGSNVLRILKWEINKWN